MPWRPSRFPRPPLLSSQPPRKILQRLPLSLDTEDDLYYTADDHQCGTDEVAESDLGDVA
jgi:hypothetical protein